MRQIGCSSCQRLIFQTHGNYQARAQLPFCSAFLPTDNCKALNSSARRRFSSSTRFCSFIARLSKKDKVQNSHNLMPRTFDSPILRDRTLHSKGAFGFDRARHCKKPFLSQALLLLRAALRFSRAGRVGRAGCVVRVGRVDYTGMNHTGVNHRHVCQCFITSTTTFKAGPLMKHTCSLWSLA